MNMGVVYDVKECDISYGTVKVHCNSESFGTEAITQIWWH